MCDVTLLTLYAWQDEDLFGKPKAGLTGNRTQGSSTGGLASFFTGGETQTKPAPAKPEIVKVITKDLIRTIK